MNTKKILRVLFLLFVGLLFLPKAASASAYAVKVGKLGQDRKVQVFTMGASVNPSGSTIAVNTSCMLVDGKPVLPVMGEFHFSRFSEKEWKKELLKMKSGGITVLATYIFWIHHEEAEGVFDWSGQRNLRRFIQTCGEVEMPVVIRVGPWCHGEVRHGGLPEWLVRSGIRLRESNAAYLEKVGAWYRQIFAQVSGLLWKDGGAIIGLQLENEYRGRGEHLMTLKKMAQDIGFDVPLYTRTGWPKLGAPVPYGEIIPLYGDYADGFWDRSTKEMPGDYGKSFVFRSFRNSTVIATEQLPPQSDKDNPDDVGYPYFTCELGGGMMTSYHRRISIAPMDIYSMALVRVGSGSNLPGYYMYHGGTNPNGSLGTLNEQQASSHTFHNDLPVKSYDFQAPLAEFGQVNPHYHSLRRLHLFLKDFGAELTAMPPVFPERMQVDFRGDSLLRWAVRSNGSSGYIFVNNYHRLKNLSVKKDVQFAIDLPNGERLSVPQTPIAIPSGASFFMPFNLPLGDARLMYASAQPMAKLTEKNGTTFVFAQLQGIPAEFVFEATSVKKVEASGVKPRVKNGRMHFGSLPAGTGAAIRLRDVNGKIITIVLLDEKNSMTCWKGALSGSERLFISSSNLTCDNSSLALDDAANTFSVAMYPAPDSVLHNGNLLKGTPDGIFTKYIVSLPDSKPVSVRLEKLSDAALPLRSIGVGKSKVAEMPQDSDFVRAAAWKIVLPDDLDAARDINLRIGYMGDVARVYAGSELLTDNFYNGKSFNLRLNYFGAQPDKSKLLLKILPWQKSDLIYLPQSAAPDFKGADYAITTPVVEAIENRSVSLIVK